jgi:isoleucyl-tRNA synthetase
MPTEPVVRALPARIDLPAVDHEILAFWREREIFQRSLSQTEGGQEWTFYEGPPTANGRPGVHHVEARVFKDVFPRYKTMKGFHVTRRAGWDCHGLPVEIAVEKELGLSGKQDIERVGIAAFNERCRESVQRYVSDFEAMTERVGYWVDLTKPYRTMDPEYVESVWWALRQIHDKGLLAEDHRVAPYCPRCGTGLSDHEVAQGYEMAEDPSVYVRLPVEGDVAGVAGAELLVWTTTPWTLVSNTAVAVHPEVTYAVVRSDRGTFVIAEALASKVLGDELEVLATVAGRDLEKTRYRRPLDLIEVPDAHFVILADYVTVEDGTGLVHQAPAFGADDLATCRRYDLPVVNPVNADGTFEAGIDLVGGLFFKDADAVLVAELDRRGVLLRAETFEHSYPHCWRCHTPLMYYAQLSWYIRTTQIRDALLRENQQTGWHPEHIKDGRFGDWLNNNIDWALSRNRYWGTPLPLWRCEEGHITCVQSRAELGELAGQDLSDLDPHRPYIDAIHFACPTCGKNAQRVPEVADAWLDSGAMPFAQLGYPWVEGSEQAFAKSYPAQFIAEAIDQTRGWFYTLMAVGTLVFDRSSYEHVLCLGHIVAEDGRKMSKHLGNVIEPIPFMDKHGADALRWYMLCAGSPWVSRRVGDTGLEEVVRKILMSYWNTVSFFTLYAEANAWDPNTAVPESDFTPLDRWLRAELHHLVGQVDQAMEDFDTTSAGRALSQFIDDLSNWYVRLSRQRFWAGEPAALATLHEAIDVLTRLLAPFTPFITEQVWQQVMRPANPEVAESVHLAPWPVQDPGALDSELREQMSVVRSIVDAGRTARKTNNLRVRQPLARVLVGVPGGSLPPEHLLSYVADELNVRRVEPLESGGEVVNVEVKPNFRTIGQRFGSQTQQVAAAIRAADAHAVADAIEKGATVELEADGQMVQIGADEVSVVRTPLEGWAVSTQREVTVALDTTITPDLRRAGLAREAVRVIQEARKQAGFAVTDRITLVWDAEGETADAIEEFGADLADAVLAVSLERADPGAGAEVADEFGLRFAITRVEPGN